MAGAPQRLTGNPIDAPANRFSQGAQTLADNLARRLTPGSLTLSDPVHSIQVDGTTVTVNTKRGTLTAQHVVLAAPPALVVDTIAFTPELATDIHRAALLTPVWMGDIIKAVAVYDEPFWRSHHLAGAAISYQGPFQEFHDHSAADGGPGAIFGFARATTFPGASESAISDAFVRQLVRIFGRDAQHPRAVQVINWANERYTTPTAAGASSRRGGFGDPLLREPAGQGRIHWASTETDIAHGGHLEGAIRSGLRVARHIDGLRRLGAPS
ncbi:MAG: FAD-dependent oxidoreductase [Propionicimonas sp.]